MTAPAPSPAPESVTPEHTSLSELAGLFLKLGTIAFGGPAAHIAMMQDEVVVRRRWLTREQFLDYLGATNLIPGPNSTELAIHIGHARAGWPGLLVAGICFIAPAVVIVTAIAAAYQRFGTLPQTTAILYGMKPIVIAVVLQALWALGRSALKTRTLVLLAVACTVAAALGMNELVILAAAGVLAMVAARLASNSRDGVTTLRQLAFPLTTAVRRGAGPAVAGAALAGAAPFGLWPLFAVFLKIGSVLFGSGYVLLAFLRSDLVQRLGWLTEKQLLDAVAVGQVTPGPVFTTATFVGYVLGGGAGALVATVGIFLPAFVFVAISGPLVPRLRRSRAAGAALDGVNVASLALMAVVIYQLARTAVVDLPTLLLAAVSAVLLLRFRVNSAWLVIGGALAGLLFAATGVARVH